MKLKSEFITHMAADQQVMVCIRSDGFRGLVRSNKTAAEIIDLLKRETTRDRLISELEKTYDAPKSVLADSVDTVLNNLRKIGALEE